MSTRRWAICRFLPDDAHLRRDASAGSEHHRDELLGTVLRGPESAHYAVLDRLKVWTAHQTHTSIRSCWPMDRWLACGPIT